MDREELHPAEDELEDFFYDITPYRRILFDISSITQWRGAWPGLAWLVPRATTTQTVMWAMGKMIRRVP
jgi:hypothetical protein